MLKFMGWVWVLWMEHLFADFGLIHGFDGRSALRCGEGLLFVCERKEGEDEVKRMKI